MPHHTSPEPRATAEDGPDAATPDTTGTITPATTTPATTPGTPAPGPGRRGLIALAGAAALGTAGLAACGSGSSGGGTAAGTGGAGAGGGAASGGASGGAAGGAGAKLAKLADVPVGGALVAAGPNGKPVVLTQPSAGKVVAFSALCTHQGCKVLVENGRLDCPCHGSRFDLTGKVITGPAKADLPPVAVKVSGTDVVAG